jgi:hypothetical protein
MNTYYRKTTSNQITFNQNGVMDTSNHHVQIANTLGQKIVNFVIELTIGAGAVALVYVIILR